MGKEDLLDHKYLLDIIGYHPTQGDLVWKVSRGQIKPGMIAGSVDPDGYRNILIDGRK